MLLRCAAAAKAPFNGGLRLLIERLSAIRSRSTERLRRGPPGLLCDNCLSDSGGSGRVWSSAQPTHSPTLTPLSDCQFPKQADGLPLLVSSAVMSLGREQPPHPTPPPISRLTAEETRINPRGRLDSASVGLLCFYSSLSLQLHRFNCRCRPAKNPLAQSASDLMSQQMN